MGSAQGMIAAMQKLIGTTENEGTNRNFITDWYGFAGPWCDMTVSYAAAHSDNAGAVGKFASTVAHAQFFHSHGRWVTGTNGIRPGDIVFYDWGGTHSIVNIDHVGVVERVHSHGKITAIEGNTGPHQDRCMRKTRYASTIVGYGRPAYGSKTPPPPNVPAPGKLEVDGEFGPATAAAMQRALVRHGAHLTVDGQFGPATKKALQSYLKVAVDGEFGPQAIKALQKHVGATADGQWGPDTTRHLQQALNAGKF